MTYKFNLNLISSQSPTVARADTGSLGPANAPVAVLALMMVLVPALGVPSELMLQDTLKSALMAFGILIAALVFFWQQRNRTQPLLWHGLVWLPLALMAYALGSMAWSHTYLAGVEAIRWFLLSLLLWLGLNTFTRENLPLLLWGIHGGAVVASIWAVLQFWFDWGFFPQAAIPASTFVNRNFFAEYLVSVLPFSAYLLANLRASRWLGVMAASLALELVVLMMTGTRSALIALVLLVPVMTYILFRYRNKLAFVKWGWGSKALVILVLLAGVFGMGSVPSGSANIRVEKVGTTALQRSFLRAASMTEGKEYTERSFSIRAVMWKATARMMMANPWSGVGAGAWEVQIPLYQGGNNSVEVDFYAHNEILQLLSEYGLVVGGWFLAVLFAYLLVAAGKTWHLHDADRQEAPLRCVTLASLLALLIVSNAGFPWRLAATGALFALCLAILAASDARLGNREAFFAAPLRWRPDLSRVALGGTLCCVMLATYITQRAAEAEWNIVNAIKLGYSVVDSGSSNSKSSAARKMQLLQYVRAGIAINPHYRKLTPVVADMLAVSGDWASAVWIWETVAVSRPNITAIWSNLVRGYTQLERENLALGAIQQLRRLEPDSRALEIVFLSRTGHELQAIKMLTDYFKSGQYDYDLVQTGYSIGLNAHNWPLAIQALELRNQRWPEQAADGHLKLGKIYADPEVHDDTNALEAFRAGLHGLPPEQQDNFRKQIPERYRAKL